MEVSGDEFENTQRSEMSNQRSQGNQPTSSNVEAESYTYSPQERFRMDFRQLFWLGSFHLKILKSRPQINIPNLSICHPKIREARVWALNQSIDFANPKWLLTWIALDTRTNLTISWVILNLKIQHRWALISEGIWQTRLTLEDQHFPKGRFRTTWGRIL